VVEPEPYTFTAATARAAACTGGGGILRGSKLVSIIVV
jgi:hypothetical protein